MVVLRRCFVGLGALLSLSTVSAVKMLYDDSLPEDLNSACAAALMADVSCDPLVPALRPDFYYPPASLSRICTAGCTAALQSWESSVRSACGKEIVIPAEHDLPASPIVLPATLRHIYSFTCLKENDVFCGPVAALTAFFSDQGVSIFNYINALPEGATKPADCDPCLAARLRIRSGSPYFDDPVVASESLYQSMTSSCGITGKPATTSTLDYFTSQPEPTQATCSGTTYEIQGSDNCYSISEAQSVGTAWMLADNNLGAYCSDFPTSGSLCITNTCKITTVAVNTTCSAIAAAANITEPQLLAWNPVINPVCSNLNMMNGTTLCIEPPGPQLPPPATTNLPPSTPTAAAPIPSNTAVGSDKPCGRWYEVEAGDYCNLVTLKFAISLPDFLFLNTGINSDCTNLFAASSYCVQPVGDINTYPGRPGHVSFTIDPNAPFTGVPFTMLPNATMTLAPRPSQAPMAVGVRDDCAFYFMGEEYQYSSETFGFWNSNCEIAAAMYGVDFDSFAAWNSLKTNVTDPACVFEVGKRYCGSWGLIPTPTDTQTPDDGKPEPPAATHSGQPADCDGWHVVSSGDSCQSVADGASISLDTFFEWNPAVSKDCTTNFWVGQAYCTHREGQGIISTSTNTSPSSSTTTTGSSPGPSPTQDGIIASCKVFYEAVAGDTCQGIVDKYGSFPLSDFIKWNPAVGEQCTGLWLGYYYCVGIAGTPTTSTSSTPTATTSPNSVQTPLPTQPNMIDYCNKFVLVKPGDLCTDITSNAGISITQFVEWNPSAGKDCTGLWADTYACIGANPPQL